MAGIIGASGNNNLGVSGVMWDSSLLIAKLFGNSGLPHCAFAPTSSATVVEAIDDVVAAGDSTLFVFSAGNFKENVETTPALPCAWDLPNIICVAAIDQDGALWDDPAKIPGQVQAGSSYGPVSVDIAAPGVDILSTARTDCTTLLGPNDSCAAGPHDCHDTLDIYKTLTGTSMSTAFVTGIAGLLMSNDPENSMVFYRRNEAYIRRIKEKILLTAQPTPSGSLDGTTLMGGFVNADLALHAFGDTFDEAPVNQRFFTKDPQMDLWAVGQNGIADACSVMTRQIAGTGDRVIEAEFNGLSWWTIATYQAYRYEPGTSSQTVVVRVTKPDGTAFADAFGNPAEQGRVGAGIAGHASERLKSCGYYQDYVEATLSGSAFGGGILDTGEPFIFFEAPYVQTTFSPINLTGVTKLSIAVNFGAYSCALYITDHSTGEVLFSQEGIEYPSNWQIETTRTGVIAYISKDATDTGSGELYLQSTVTIY